MEYSKNLLFSSEFSGHAKEFLRLLQIIWTHAPSKRFASLQQVNVCRPCLFFTERRSGQQATLQLRDLIRMVISNIVLCYACSLNFVHDDLVLRFWAPCAFSCVMDLSDKHVASFFMEKFRPSSSLVLPKKKIHDENFSHSTQQFYSGGRLMLQQQQLQTVFHILLSCSLLGPQWKMNINGHKYAYSHPADIHVLRITWLLQYKSQQNYLNALYKPEKY